MKKFRRMGAASIGCHIRMNSPEDGKLFPFSWINRVHPTISSQRDSWKNELMIF